MVPPDLVRSHIIQAGQVMLAFQIIGGIFVLLFLAAAMTGIEGTAEH